MEIYAVMMRLFDEQKFEVAELEQWLRDVVEKIWAMRASLIKQILRK